MNIEINDPVYICYFGMNKHGEQKERTAPYYLTSGIWLLSHNDFFFFVTKIIVLILYIYCNH